MKPLHIGLVYTIIRKEEKLIIAALEKKGHQVIKINDKEQLLCLDEQQHDPLPVLDIVVMRSMSLQRSLWFAKYFASQGIKVVNDYSLIDTCGNKYLTSLALVKYKIPTPKVIMAFDQESALQAMKKIGFPCVIKPLIGSWGRLIAKVKDVETGHMLLEHKQHLNTHVPSVFYIQEYIPGGHNDIRTIVIGHKVIGAIKRMGTQWKANTALGAQVQPYPLNAKLKALSLKTAKAVGSGIVSIDLFEHNGSYLVNEVNATTEFRKSLDAYGIDIPQKIAEHIIKEART